MEVVLNIILKILVGLVGLFCAGMALLWIVTPESGGAQFGVALNGVQGLSSGRADVGGMFLATAVLSFLGLRRGKSAAGNLYAAAIIMGSVAVGRIVGFALDGVIQMTLMPFIFELLFVAVLVTAARQFRDLLSS